MLFYYFTIIAAKTPKCCCNTKCRNMGHNIWFYRLLLFSWNYFDDMACASHSSLYQPHISISMYDVKCLDAVHVFMCNCVLCIPPWPTLACSFTPHPPLPSLLLTKTEFSVNTPWPEIGRWNTALVQQKILSFLNFISWHIIRSFAITIRVIFMLENFRSLLFVLCFHFA